MISIAMILIAFSVSVGLFSLFFGILVKNKFLTQNQNNERIDNNLLVQNFLEQRKDNQFKITDEMIIRLAHHLNNRLCAEDLVKQTQMTIQEAKERLDGLAQKGICEIRLDEVQSSGKIYYYFD